MRASDSRSIAFIMLILVSGPFASRAGAQNDQSRERQHRFSFLMLGAWAGPGSASDLKSALIRSGFGDDYRWPGGDLMSLPRSFGGSTGLEFELGYEHPSAWGLAVSAGRADFGLVQGFRATSETGEEGDWLHLRHSIRHISPTVTYRFGPLRTSLGPSFVQARTRADITGPGYEEQEMIKVGLEASVGASTGSLLPFFQLGVRARYRLVGSPEVGPFTAYDGALPKFRVGLNHWQLGVGLGLHMEVQGAAGTYPPADLTVADLGRIAGRDAAAAQRTFGYALAGFLGGLPIGIWGPYIEQSDCRSFVLGGLAVAGITSAVALTRNRAGSGEPSQGIENQDPRYGDAYRASYRKELLHRQLRSILRGSLIGAVAGLGLLLLSIPAT